MPSHHAETKVGASVIPAGEPGEQLIAHLMLSLVAFHSDDLDIGQKHLSYAHSVAASLEKHGHTYRAANRMRVVGISSGTDQQTETLLVPVVSGRLVVPGIDLQRAAGRLRSQPREQPTIALQAIEIFHYELRLRPARIARSLAAIMDLETAAQLLAQTEEVLTASLADKRRTVDSIDLAHDYLTLTYDLAAISNPMLADMALKQATRAIDQFTVGHPDLAGLPSVAAFRAKVAVLAKDLRASVS